MDDSTDNEQPAESESDTDHDGWVKYHLTEQQAEKAVERFRGIGSTIASGKASTTGKGEIHLMDFMVDQANPADTAFYIGDRPLDEWLTEQGVEFTVIGRDDPEEWSNE
jgi:hypothetical protein